LHVESAVRATDHIVVLTGDDSLMSLMISILVLERAHNPSIVLIVREFDVFEHKPGHWEFKSVGFLHLLLDLFTEFGQVRLLLLILVTIIVAVGTLVIVIGSAASEIGDIGGVRRCLAERRVLLVETPVAFNPANVFFGKLCRKRICIGSFDDLIASADLQILAVLRGK